jgi:hypothetical protein
MRHRGNSLAQRRNLLRIVGGAIAVSLLFAGCEVDNMYPTDNSGYDCFSGDANVGRKCQTDNSGLTVWINTSGPNALLTADVSNVQLALNESFNTTNLNVTYHQTPVTSGGSETDIIYRRNDVGLSAGDVGITFCDDAVSSTKCDQHYVSFGTVSGGLATVVRGLACHETGHAVGLTHGAEAAPVLDNDDGILGCMKTNIPLASFPIYLLDQNIKMINSTY